MEQSGLMNNLSHLPMTPESEVRAAQEAGLVHIADQADLVRLQRASALLKERLSVTPFYAQRAEKEPFYWIRWAQDYPNLCLEN